MHNVSFLDNNQDFNVEDGQTIFEALEDQGELLPHGCLSGSCGACRVEIVEGHQKLSTPGDVELDTINSIKVNLKRLKGEDYDENIKVRLSCRTKVHGDCKFKIV